MGVVLLFICLSFFPTWLKVEDTKVLIRGYMAAIIHLECPEGWTKGGSKCFKLENERIERSDAHRRCINHYSASLAVIENEAENKVVQDLLGGQLSAWIGLRCIYGHFYWDDKYEFQYNYSNLASGRTYGDCVRILSTGDWRRAYRSFDSSYVCFKKAEQSTDYRSGIRSLTRSGRPSVTSQRQGRQIVRNYLQDRFPRATDTALQTIGPHNRPISADTVRGRLRGRNLCCYRPYRSTVLTAHHRQNRLQ